MAKAYLGLGSNIGDTKEHLDNAIDILRSSKDIVVLKKSSYYKTEPIGYENQDWFLNMVVEVETTLEPKELLQYCQLIETQLKRKRIVRWGPRTIDIDILLYENYSSNQESLIVPHPRMTERAFVMIPLYEIAPDLLIKDVAISEVVKQLEGLETVIKEI
ncbi:2-amino-4-hydroxy-6-hydroxymethyldihydropteridine diphosphokinase [Alkalibaculum sp. M08DMB]|uniref:2-amino-4-hydroxy-6-hydroxymethyldihydropteridine diphosphokinase n=1 Tax=Alkalibaculum sporogenes TaxID=2655001 RepID=A0A6A7K6L9_9FIRM|nr:2-amino-4-hydroxy-6-hydroxymethyldihydropteridine diphosphokinase [Alkalibaculum sporogenes]MPW25080.1 2-amino-4-hydroxy-6-hydroxymethyldihydropteridine diphosphokinase [Alkalibaculum sporogenes]